MTPRSALEIVLLPLLAACVADAACGEPPGAQPGRYENATVVSVSAIPPLSGTTATWVEIVFEPASDASFKSYVRYMTASQRMPEVGSICDVTVVSQSIRGMTVDQKFDGSEPKLRIVNMNCNFQAAQ